MYISTSSEQSHNNQRTIENRSIQSQDGKQPSPHQAVDAVDVGSIQPPRIHAPLPVDHNRKRKPEGRVICTPAYSSIIIACMAT